MSKLTPRETGKYTASVSKNVTIVTEHTPKAAKKIFNRMKEEKYSMSSWKQWPLHPKDNTKETVDWIFVVDCLNFSFWLPGNKQFQLEHDGIVYEDYEALCAAINRGLKEGIQITTPSYYKDVTLETIQHIFRSCNGTTLPLLEQRVKNLNEAGNILYQRYNNSFSNLLLECHNDVSLVINTVTNQFSSFQDEAVFNGQCVCFYKRVQILIGDVWACFEGASYGEFRNIEELTMFADYRVPQALLALNVLSYSAELMCKLQNGVTLENKSTDEMEIRGCSIHAVELLREELVALKSAESAKMIINSVIIDFYLWDFATQQAGEMKSYPEHRTRSIYY